jgi:hypothetical protein
MDIEFERGTRLREIGYEAFAYSPSVQAFTVPSSVETIGDRCFEYCSRMTKIAFAKVSGLKRIGERAFAFSGLISITIPASVEEIDGSAFVSHRLLEVRVARKSRNFVVQGSLLTTADGKKL